MTRSDGGSAPSLAPERESSRVRVGGWSIETDSGEASKGPRQVRLQPRPLSVLLHLARHRGRVVSKEELLANVWEDRFVTQDVVWRAISTLRRCLCDPDGPAASLIETLPGRGYRVPQARDPAPATEASRATLPLPAPDPSSGERARLRRRTSRLVAGLTAAPSLPSRGRWHHSSTTPAARGPTAR